MTPSPEHRPPATGLRERKKAKTRTEIQRQALRLFREQGFHATTVEQIAEAAEVAPSTVFRYFATKEELAALDDHYALRPLIVRVFTEQPAHLSALQALRETLRAVFAELSPEERAARRDRDAGLVLVPELWAANAGLLAKGLEVLGELVAERTGRTPEDPAIRALTGAVLGVALAAFLRWSQEPGGDPMADLDDALAHLAEGAAL
ncbi:TetR family transcriptional regulator [Streptomonospora nanhaiensis]|uniref:AcrR family transcriptional regulator n=1 Tax=Streptomonospora nanhaiensis TaxID=1323731 RepID=A0A853BIA8_9ACTN|nr:TetR family transcriptional regulator [Streptomonospora nanhaiensis]MBV2364195.1 TetR family transcriptional regulator [Streptomonospora nanhaiensis]MBX9386685.1 TetR family transcriptional regulator [Streptomonospora nanhaiensis]NYI95149.1 AcrR family transcriptional regulator [Streptomonospora nanhaiensis]